MKKVFIALALMGGIFALSSCAKDCTCTAKYNGDVVYESSVKLEEGDKCSNHDSYVNVLGQKLELKCTPNLF